jgi:hypothetical protein
MTVMHGQLTRCVVARQFDLFHGSRVITGLSQLSGPFTVECASWITNRLSLQVETCGLRIGIELSDHSDVFDEELLARSDLYFKRSYYEPDLARIATGLRSKIMPLGLNYACRSHIVLLRTLGFFKIRPVSHHELYRTLVMPHYSVYEYAPDAPCEASILFQARLWSPADAPGDADVNQKRVELLRALRRAFGRRVVGGLVPSPLACEQYPDLLTTFPCRQPAYIRAAKKPLIGIYFRGLFHSVAFKLPEYLAASKCIVSESIRNRLPEPLVHGKHLLNFTSHDECLAHCDRLLSSPLLARQLRESAWEYYVQEVAPAAHMRNVIMRACTAASNTVT